jgi:hypothetical protein
MRTFVAGLLGLLISARAAAMAGVPAIVPKPRAMIWLWFLLVTVGCSGADAAGTAAATDYVVLRAELGTVPVDIPFNELTFVTMPSPDGYVDVSTLDEATVMAAQPERRPIQSVSYSFYKAHEVSCPGPDWLLAACAFASRDGIRIGIVAIASAGSHPADHLQTTPAPDGSLTRTDLGRRVVFSALVNGRPYEADCLRAPGAIGVDFICEHLTTNGTVNWRAQIGVANDQLSQLPATMAWIETFVNRIMTSGTQP